MAAATTTTTTTTTTTPSSTADASGLDIFASDESTPRAHSPEPSAGGNPFDPLSPASKPVNDESGGDTNKPKSALDLMSQIANWGTQNADTTDDRTPKESKEGGDGQDGTTDKPNGDAKNIMCVREDAVDLSDEAIEDILHHDD